MVQHAHSTLHLGQVSRAPHSGGLVVDTNLKACGAPVHKLNTALGLDGSNGGVDILGYHVSTVQQAAGHVLAMAGITLHHLVGRLKQALVISPPTQLLVVAFSAEDDWCIGGQGEVDARVGHQAGLETSVRSTLEGAISAGRL